MKPKKKKEKRKKKKEKDVIYFKEVNGLKIEAPLFTNWKDMIDLPPMKKSQQPKPQKDQQKQKDTKIQ
jgi:hypothetical protein